MSELEEKLNALLSDPNSMAQCMQMGGFALYTVSSVYYVNEIIPVQDAVKGQSFLGAAGTIGAVAANVLGGALLDFF